VSALHSHENNLGRLGVRARRRTWCCASAVLPPSSPRLLPTSADIRSTAAASTTDRDRRRDCSLSDLIKFPLQWTRLLPS
jgi:hypothetical protein